MKELNHRDPSWAAKVRAKKEADIAVMDQAKKQVRERIKQREIQIR